LADRLDALFTLRRLARAALVLGAALALGAQALGPVALLLLLAAAAAVGVVVHDVGEELAAVEVDLAELDRWPLLGAEDVVDVGADAELAGERVLDAEQRPGPALVGQRRPPRGLDRDEQVAGEAEHGLGCDLEVALDEVLALAAGRQLAHADARRGLDVAAHA